VIRCRFDFDKQVSMRLAEQMGADGAETLDRFRRVVTSTTKPPLPLPAMLGETIVHGEDIRRPLGIKHDHPVAALTRLAEYYQGTDQVVLAKGRIKGLHLVANDGPFSTAPGRWSPAPPWPWSWRWWGARCSARNSAAKASHASSVPRHRTASPSKHRAVTTHTSPPACAAPADQPGRPGAVCPAISSLISGTPQ
jgi:hypothetical protein